MIELIFILSYISIILVLLSPLITEWLKKNSKNIRRRTYRTYINELRLHYARAAPPAKDEQVIIDFLRPTLA